MNNLNESKFQEMYQSPSFKAVLIGVLILILLIPLQMVDGLIYERAGRKNEVLSEISDKWGGGVLFYGPILKLPYYTYEEVYVTKNGERDKSLKRKINNAYIFPERLNHDINLTSKKLYRSIYESVVFSADVDIKGYFGNLNFSDHNITDSNVLWSHAKLIIKTTSLKSIQNELQLNVNKNQLDFEPILSDVYSTHTLESKAFDFKEYFKNKGEFDLRISYNGSDEIQTVPIGKSTKTNISADWKDPSFFGYFLPSDEDKVISDSGFVANWDVNHLNRPFSQMYLNNLPSVERYAYGVNLKILNDDYQQSTRTSKYGLLVITLTFLVFFMIQIINKFQVHLLHYLLVGLALVLFYSLLVSISEHTRFFTAYLIASIAVIAMIGLYVLSILKKGKFAGIVVVAMSVLYTYIYVILQLDTYALLSGSIGLFVILGLVMYFSRKVTQKIE